MSSTLLTLLALSLSATAVQLQSGNAAFNSAGIQGCVSVPDNADGAPLVIHDCNTEALVNQDWSLSFFDKQSAGPQPITVFGNKCIDVTGGVNADGTKLQIWTCVAGSKNQQWTSVSDFTLQWSGTNKCIDLTGGSITDGTQLQIYTCATNNANQKWLGAPNPDTTNVGTITGGDSSAGGGGPYCLAAASNTNGAAIALAACLNTDFHTTFPAGNITFVSPISPLTGTFATFGGAMCLDVPGGSTANGVKLQLWACSAGNTNQRFQRNGLKIEWAGTGKCVDLTNGNSTSGNPLQLWDCATDNTNVNQLWFSSS